MASIVYNGWKAKNGLDWEDEGETFKVMLVTGSYTPDPDDGVVDDVSPSENEIAGGSYARQTLAGRAITINTDDNKAEHRANSVLFEGLTGPAQPRYAIVYREENDDSDHELVACIDLGSGLSVTGMFRVRWDDGESGGVVFEAA